MDLIAFLLIDPKPAASVSRKPGTIIMRRSFPGMRERNIKIREMVTEIGEIYKFDKSVQENLFRLAQKKETKSDDIKKNAN